MCGIRLLRRVGAVCAAVLVLLGGAIVAPGAEVARALDTHPCLPGEMDYVGEVEFIGGGKAFWVTFCLDRDDPPTPSLPWGSPSVGHPCEAGETDGISKVHGDIEGSGPVTIWFCDDAVEPAPPPPPGSRPSTRSPSTPPRPTFTPVGPSTLFVPISPRRVLDSRQAGSTRLAPDEVRRVDLSAVLADTMTGAAVNVTAAEAEGPGFMTVWDCGASRPGTSTVNFRAGGTAAAGAVVQMDGTRQFCVYTSAAAHLIVDVNGGYAPTGGFGYTSLTPRRVHDSRPVPIPAGSTTQVQITGLTRAPRAAVVNLTAVAPEADGYLTAWPCSIARPEVSNLNFPAGISAVANAAQVPVDADGSVCIYNSAATGLLVDVVGVYDDAPTGRRYQPAVPIRVLDTRAGTGGWNGPIGNRQTLDVWAPDQAYLGVLGTVTLVDPPQAGFLTVDGYVPSASARTFSTINATDTTIANMFVASGNSTLVAVAGPTGGEHVLIDLTGYFVAP